MAIESSASTSLEQRASLIRSYGNLYAQSRVETLEWLDKMEELRGADELKSKLLFSVIVVFSLCNFIHFRKYSKGIGFHSWLSGHFKLPPRKWRNTSGESFKFRLIWCRPLHRWHLLHLHPSCRLRPAQFRRHLRSSERIDIPDWKWSYPSLLIYASLSTRSTWPKIQRYENFFKSTVGWKQVLCVFSN